MESYMCSKCSNVLRVNLNSTTSRRFVKGFMKHGFDGSIPNGFEHIKSECLESWGVDCNVEDVKAETTPDGGLLLKYETNGVGPVKWLNLLSSQIEFRCSGFNQDTGYYYAGSSDELIEPKNIDNW